MSKVEVDTDLGDVLAVVDKPDVKAETAEHKALAIEKFCRKAGTLGVERVDTDDEVSVEKPNNQDFFRVCPDENYTMDMYLYDEKEENSFSVTKYVVLPELVPVGEKCFKKKTLKLCVYPSGKYFIWDISDRYSANGGINTWAVSHYEIAELAETTWVRLSGNKGGRCLAHKVTGNKLGEPVFPKKSFFEILQAAFPGDRMVDSSDHRIFKKLREGVA